MTGWVKNLDDGEVEAVAEGAPEDVASFVKWCGKGPAQAAVESVTLWDDEPATGEFGTFEVVR